MGYANAVTPTSSGFMRSGHSSASEFKNPVQSGNSDGDFRSLGLVSTRSKGIADHAFVSTDCCLDLGPKIVATRLLPAHPAVLDDLLDVSVPLCRSGRSGRARDCGCARRHDDGGIRMTLGDRLVNAVLIVGTVSRERRDGIGDLVEQCARPRGVIDLFTGQLNRDDFAAFGIDADMQLTPGSAAGRAVLFNQSFAGPAKL